MVELHLEDPIQVGHSFTCLAVLMVRGNEHHPHKLRSMVHGTNLTFSGTLDEGESTFLLLQTMVVSTGDTVYLKQDEQTSVIPRPPFTATGLRQVIELCAGIGCLGWGMKAADFKIVLRVDHNEKMNQFSNQLDKVPTLQKDICDNQTIADICKLAPTAGVLTSGVACQPYSKLGDKQMQNDPRSLTLPSSLKIGFLTRKAIILLECVDDAYTCKWVQGLIEQFVKQSQYRCSQGLLHLQSIWPARRSRWWCLLVHPGVGRICWQEFPSVQPKPMVLNILESFKQCTPDELSFLELDRYEVGKFSTKGIDRNVVQRNGQMNTSLHSCGSQLSSCPCGCRTHPFSEHRLAEGGLHGLLIQISAASEPSDFPRFRHIHPTELALLNGMHPKVEWGEPSQYKMALCGLGQLASPLQAGWIAAQIRSALAEQNMWHPNPPTPNETLKYMMQQLLLERDQIFGNQTHPNAVFFDRMVWGDVNNFVLPSPFETNQSGSTDIQSLPHENRPETSFLGSIGLQHEPPMDDFEWSLLQEPIITKPFCETEAFQKGAVAGFEVHTKVAQDTMMAKRRKLNEQLAIAEPVLPPRPTLVVPAMPSQMPLSEDASGHHRSEENSLPAEDQTKAPVHLKQHELGDKQPEHDSSRIQEVCIVHVAVAGAAIVPITLPIHTTACQLTVAEEQLGTLKQPIAVTTAMGEYMKQLDVIQPDQFLILHDGRETPRHFGLKCPFQGGNAPPTLCNDKRDILLWQQFGWVAVDEMNYYLSMLQDQSVGMLHDVMVIHEDITAPACTAEFILKLAGNMQNEQKTKVGSAILYHHHWIPIAVELHDESLEIHTSQDFVAELREWCKQVWEESTVPCHGHKVAHVFPADCGFQTIGWLSSFVGGSVIQVDGKLAGEWRGRFHRQLEADGIADSFVHHPIVLGGMAVIDELQQVVQTHGVKSSRSRECADMLLQKLGSATIQHILKSPKPWADLKARTSALSPPVRIVTSDELQDMIKGKLEQGGSLGRKANKTKNISKKDIDHFHLKADQIIVPHAVFRQADGQELSQINSNQINKGSQGIVIVNIDEAIPYFSLSSPVTTEGLGLLILDFDDHRIPAAKEILKVPSHCAQTNEPIIFTAALLQLGCKQVKRNIPETCLAVQEVENQVLRIVVYKDQFPHEWSSFANNPVRHLMTQNLAEHQSQVLDVWDRQFLTSRLTKCSPQEAALFAVNIRVQSVVVKDAFVNKEAKTASMLSRVMQQGATLMTDSKWYGSIKPHMGKLH